MQRCRVFSPEGSLHCLEVLPENCLRQQNFARRPSVYRRHMWIHFAVLMLSVFYVFFR